MLTLVNPIADALDDELRNASAGGAGFKAIRGEYGSGKTFLVWWPAEWACTAGFAIAEVQISEGETPLHRSSAEPRVICYYAFT